MLFAEKEFLCDTNVDDIPRKHLVLSELSVGVERHVDSAFVEAFAPALVAEEFIPRIKLKALFVSLQENCTEPSVASCENRLNS